MSDYVVDVSLFCSNSYVINTCIRTYKRSTNQIQLPIHIYIHTYIITCYFQATVVEILTLHKVNYDFFVRDLEELERRENFHLLSDCKLFKSWSKVTQDCIHS